MAFRIHGPRMTRRSRQSGFMLTIALSATATPLVAAPPDPPPATPLGNLSHEQMSRCLEAAADYVNEPSVQNRAQLCPELPVPEPKVTAVGGRELEAPEMIVYAPWQAEIRSNFQYTADVVQKDRDLPADDPGKFFLDQKQDWERQHRCGGSYIGNGWVLTAAHCLTLRDEHGKIVPMDPIKDRRVRLGSIDLSQPGPDFAITAAVIHKGYTLNQTRDDIALLKLDMRKVRSLDGVEPARILDAQRDAPIVPGDKVFVTGWGVTSATVGGIVPRALDGTPLRASARLKMVELQVKPNERCDAVDTLHGTISPAVICAGSDEPDQDACTGDSGGPLMRRSDLVLVGIISRGKGCNLKDTPAVYTRVSLYDAWIKRAKRAPAGRVTVLQ